MGKNSSFKPKSSKNSSSKKFNSGPKGKFINKKKKNFKQGRQQNDVQQNFQANDIQNAYGTIDRKKMVQMPSNKQLQKIKEFQMKILQKPQENIKYLEGLFFLTKINNLKVVANALRVIANIFVNITPLEPINIQGLQERTQTKITKDQFVVIKFQRTVVQQYEKYIKILKELKAKLKAQNFNQDQQMFVQFRKCILQCGLTLFNTLWNFNYSKQLCDLLLGFIKFKQCQEVMKKLLQDKNIATVQIKVNIIKGIAQLIKKKDDQQLPNQLIKILNATYIDSRYLQKDKQALDFKKKKLKQRMYKQQAFEKKAQKQKGKQENDKLAQKRKKKIEKIKIKMKIKQQIDKQFAEGQAVISNKQVVKNNSMILQELFYVYFKILVQKISSKFLKDALDGILTFAHFINIDLISSMIQHLNSAAKIFRDIWKKTPSSSNMQLRLIIVFTMQSILNGPLSVYNMDDVSVTANFFKILKDINNNSFKNHLNKQTFRLICMNLDEAFVKRRQLSQEIVGSFLRQISILLTKKELPKLYLLQFIRLTASKYSKIGRMFQQDNEGFGLNAYNQICEDPQSTNAINTQILSKLNSLQKFDKNSKQYDKELLEYITRLNRQNFQRIQGTQALESILKDDLAVGF